MRNQCHCPKRFWNRKLINIIHRNYTIYYYYLRHRWTWMRESTRPNGSKRTYRSLIMRVGRSPKPFRYHIICNITTAGFNNITYLLRLLRYRKWFIDSFEITIILVHVSLSIRYYTITWKLMIKKKTLKTMQIRF